MTCFVESVAGFIFCLYNTVPKGGIILKTTILSGDISEEKAFLLSKIFANKLPLFDFINSFFNYINYDYQIVDGKVNVLKLNNRVSNGNLAIYYDDGDSIRLNICGIYHIIIEILLLKK